MAGDVAHGGGDRAVYRVDTVSGAPLPPLTGHRRYVEALVATAHGVASGSSDATIRVWDPEHGTPRVLRGHEAGVRALATTPDGAEIVSVYADGTWRRWDARTGAAGPVTAGGGPYNSVLTTTSDGRLVVTATEEHAIEVWERTSGRLVAALPGHTGYVESLAVLPGDELLVSGSWDRTVRVWDLATGAALWTLPCAQWITDLVVTSGGVVVACCADGTLVLADPVARTVRGVLELGGEAFGEIVLGEDDRTAFVLSAYELQAWDIAAGVRLASFDADLPLRRIALGGPDTVVIGTDVGTLVAIRLERA